jgi:hypothetical protein
MSNERRRFVGRIVGGAMTMGPVGSFGGDLWADEPELTADGEKLAREWERRQGPDKPKWDMTWTERVTGKHRQVFDAPSIEEGLVFHQTRTYLQGFIDVYGAKDSDFSAVMVIRHAAIPMAVNDALWDQLELGKAFKLKDPETGKAARRNPFLNANSPKDAKYSMLWPDGGLDTLISRGVIALCCNLALFRIVSMIANREKVDPKTARDKALANVVPGLIVQPSGIFAVARAEEAGCNFLRAT